MQHKKKSVVKQSAARSALPAMRMELVKKTRAASIAVMLNIFHEYTGLRLRRLTNSIPKDFKYPVQKTQHRKNSKNEVISNENFYLTHRGKILVPCNFSIYKANELKDIFTIGYSPEIGCLMCITGNGMYAEVRKGGYIQLFTGKMEVGLSNENQ
ncbi:MAG TPA: hypothetical protein VJG83_01980 [archaeon]|nr:hypothetical protein [archaeon]